MEEEKLTAKGIDIHGKEIEFECTLLKRIWCPKEQLVSLIIPEGVTHVYCHNNPLTELKLPKGVTWVSCRGNQLKELNLPEGVTYVDCYRNQLTELILPKGVKYLYADKEITGLEKYIGTDVKINLY